MQGRGPPRTMASFGGIAFSWKRKVAIIIQGALWPRNQWGKGTVRTGPCQQCQTLVAEMQDVLCLLFGPQAYSHLKLFGCVCIMMISACGAIRAVLCEKGSVSQPARGNKKDENGKPKAIC